MEQDSKSWGLIWKCLWIHINNPTHFGEITDEEYVKQEQELEISGEYVEEGKQYQTEGDEEIIAYDSGSQENGKLLRLNWNFQHQNPRNVHCW